MVLPKLILAVALSAVAFPAKAEDLAAAVSAAAHAACRVASQEVGSMFPGLQQTWSDNTAAERRLTEAKDRLHLASLPLQNSDCAGAAPGTPECVALDAAYRAAREEVLRVEPAAASAARTYAVNLARYQTAAGAATRLCAAAMTAEAVRAKGAMADSDVVALVQEVLTQTNDLIAALNPAADAAIPVTVAPPLPTEAVVPVPSPPAGATLSDPTNPVTPTTPGVSLSGSEEAHFTWMWQFAVVGFNGTYSGDFATSWTFNGTSVSGKMDVVGTVQCAGSNVPTEGWPGGEGRMDCTATFPANAAHGPLTWRGSCRGLANYDGMLLKGGGSGTYTDDTGTHESGMEVCSVRAGLAPV